LNLEKDNILCEAEYEVHGFLLGGKSYYNIKEYTDISYCFEYNKDKFIFNCYSFQESENVRIDTLDKEIVDEVLKVLEDVQLQIAVEVEPLKRR
jgi:hypothetical protein